MVTIEQGELGFNLAQNGEWWPGVYDSEETAQYALGNISYEMLEYLSHKICAVYSQNRTITLEDLKDVS